MFFAHYDEAASWIDELKPAFSDRFFFEDQFPADVRWKNFTVYSGARFGAASSSGKSEISALVPKNKRITSGQTAGSRP